jgi:hypothetical protein
MLLRSFSILVVFSAFATLHADQKPDSAAKIKIVDIVNDQTVKVVAAAEELLATLSDDERAKTIFKFNDEDQRLRWSNLPTGIFERKGLRMGDLKQEQIDAVMGLIKATMSSDGYQQVVDNIAGEETLKDGGRGRLVFGKDEYYLSILGTPSRTEPWMWQFGGHHLAINATIIGDQITLAPSLTGGQPMRYAKDGKVIVQMADEVAVAFELVNALDAEQKKKAILSQKFGELAFGPGRDDVHPEPEGIRGSELSEEQKTLLKRLITERVSLLNDEDAAPKLEAIDAALNDTWFSWRGQVKSGGAASYRVQSSTFFLEFAPQQMGGAPMQHVHAMYREFKNDYGEQMLHAK